MNHLENEHHDGRQRLKPLCRLWMKKKVRKGECEKKKKERRGKGGEIETLPITMVERARDGHC